MKKLFVYMKPYRVSIFLSMILTALNNGLQVLLPAMMSLVINNGVAKGDINYVKQMGIVMVAVSLGAVLLGVICSIFTSKASTGLGASLRRAIFVKTQELASSDINDISTASILIRNTNDVNQVQTIFQNCIKMVVSAIVMMIGGTVMSFLMNKTLSAILFAVLAVIVVVVILVSKKIIPMYDIVQTRTDKLNKVLREKLSGIRVVRAFNRSEYEDEKFNDSSNALANIYVKINRIYALLIPIGVMLLFSIIITLVYVNCRQIMSMDAVKNYEQIANTVGNLQAFVMYVLMIIAAITMATSVLVMIPKAMISVNRINEILDKEPSVQECENTKDFTDRGTVEFKNVSFKYPGTELNTLNNISFTAEKGKTTAIIGSTGSGKTTILNLMTRSYDVEEGEVLVGGVNVKELKKSDLCQTISEVPQTAILFSGTIAENLRFGKEDATDDEILRASKIAQADEFVNEMPDKYDTMLSQGGKNLSGGQKQRLTIARAIVKESDIYVFDDSFSALDFKTDAALRASLKTELSDKTIIIVAQRIGSIIDADKIIVLGEGEIAGIGTHKELAESCELYRAIMKSQLSKEDFADEK